MAILSTNQRLINVGDSYSAGNGIDITNNIISVTGDNAPYSAGQNIYFNGDDNHVINGKDWGSEINDASANAYNVTTAWVQDNYANSADVSYLSGVIDNKLDTSAWSSVSSNFATEDYVIVADNITYDRAKGYVDSKGYATEEFVNENTSGKLESTAFDTWRNGQYSTDLQTIEGQIANKLDSSSFSDVSGTFYPTTNPSSFVNEDWVTAQGYITGVDLSEYAERAFVLSSIESATSGKLDVSSFASVSSDFLTTSFEIPESATWNDTSNVVQSNSAQWADGGTTYTSPSGTILIDGDTLEASTSALSPIVKTVNVTPSNSYFSAIPGYPFDRYILNRDVDKGGYAVILYGTWSQGVSVTIDNNFENPYEIPLTRAGFNLSTYNGYYSKISAVKSGVVELALKSDLPTYEYDDTNKISAINGSALAAGSSLTGDAQGAVDNVYTNSGKYVLNNANGVYIGNDNTATLNGFAQGGSNKAQSYAFSQGLYNSAIGYSIAQGQFCTASNESIAQGVGNSATEYSQAFGSHTKANNSGMAIGIYNNITTGAFVIGNGNSNQRSDCFIIDHDGNVSACGKISANGVELGAGVTGEYVPLDTNGSNVSINLRKKEWQFSGGYSQGKISLGDGSNGAYISYSSTGGHPEYNWSIGGGGVGGYHYRLNSLGVSGNDWNFGSAEYNRLVPTSTTADENKILSVNNQGKPEWVTGGGDVPTGTMNVSGLEYNAINEISAYNGSAIAQYGAEKQWLVHDGTLCHLSNSAQYALGVNVSAVEKLATIDLQPKVGEETFAGYWNDHPVYQRIITMSFNSNGNTTAAIPSALNLSAVELGRRWIDAGQSWIHYGSENISLPITWFLGTGRQGCVSLLSNSLAYRGVDNANTGCTAYLCLKYRKKQ